MRGYCEAFHLVHVYNWDKTKDERMSGRNEAEKSLTKKQLIVFK